MNDALHYQGRELVIRTDLAELLAKRDGHDKTIRFFWQYESEARKLVDAWRRNPQEPETEIERLCQAVVENDEAATQARIAIAEARNNKEKIAAMRPAADPTVIKIVVKDERSGRLIRLTVPKEWVELHWEG